MKILVVGPSWVGDTVLAQPLFKLLHARHPRLALDVLAPRWTFSLLERMPEVRQAIESPFAHGELKLGERRRLGHALRAERYDQAIVLPNSFKSALVPFFADIRIRTGYLAELRHWILTDARRLDGKRLTQMAQRYAALLSVSVGNTTVAGTLVQGEPRIVFIDGFWVDVPVEGHLLLTKHQDKPGLVGRVVDVSSRRSIVRLITDPASSVGLRIVRSGETAIAQGEGAGRTMSVGFVDIESDVKRGDLAVTSGLEGGSDLYPASIPVGRVVKARKVSGGAPAGKLTERCLELTENRRLSRGEAHIAREHEFAAGAAYATYDYARDYEGRLLPGTSVAGAPAGCTACPPACSPSVTGACLHVTSPGCSRAPGWRCSSTRSAPCASRSSPSAASARRR